MKMLLLRAVCCALLFLRSEESELEYNDAMKQYAKTLDSIITRNEQKMKLIKELVRDTRYDNGVLMYEGEEKAGLQTKRPERTIRSINEREKEDFSDIKANEKRDETVFSNTRAINKKEEPVLFIILDKTPESRLDKPEIDKVIEPNSKAMSNTTHILRRSHWIEECGEKVIFRCLRACRDAVRGLCDIFACLDGIKFKFRNGCKEKCKNVFFYGDDPEESASSESKSRTDSDDYSTDEDGSDNSDNDSDSNRDSDCS